MTPEEFRIAYRERLNTSSIDDVTTLNDEIKDGRYVKIIREERKRFQQERGLYKPGFWERVFGWFKTKEV